MTLTSPDTILFIVQLFLALIVICTSLLNLTQQWGTQDLWIAILTGTLGYVMPNPKLKNHINQITN